MKKGAKVSELSSQLHRSIPGSCETDKLPRTKGLGSGQKGGMFGAWWPGFQPDSVPGAFPAPKRGSERRRARDSNPGIESVSHAPRLRLTDPEEKHRGWGIGRRRPKLRGRTLKGS